MPSHATYRRHSSKRLPPVPPEFVEQFVLGGYRRIERIYGGRNDLVRKWIEMSGGESVLKAKRREHLIQSREVE
jgi:hypothetical protein